MSEVEKWLNHISAYDREFANWEKRTKKIIERYTDQKSMARKSARFSILWSNVQTLTPAVFSRLPKPEVSRRFKDNDPVGRVAAMLLERCLDFEVEHYGDYRSAMKNCVQDRFLGGRGTSWVRYEPHTGPMDDMQVSEDAEVEATEELKYECAPVDYVHWRDFGHVLSRTWEEVPGIWRKVYMGNDALVERFPEFVKNGRTTIPLDTKPEELKKSGISDNDGSFQACIYEIWSKEEGKALWLSKSLGKVLDEKADPLKLEGFWPCPKPLYATLTSDNLVPTPDLVLYQDQADECDTLANTIDGLIKALKVRGVYDASVPELARLFTDGQNNDLIPVKNWSAFVEKQGLKGAIDIVDLSPIANALEAAYGAFEKVIASIYQLTGISDILRGDNDAEETATATRTKGQFGTLRLRDMQKSVAEFATDLLRIKAQIICAMFQPETIKQIGAADQLSETDQPLVDQAIALLKSGNMRAFRIEVETDSLVQMDEIQEKQDRVEFLGAVAGFLKEAVPAAMSTPQLTPLLMQLLKFAVTGFKVGKSIEGDIDAALDQFKQMAANPPPPPPDPEMIKVQGQMQIEQQKLESSQMLAQAELQMQERLEQTKAAMAMKVEEFKQNAQAMEAQHTNDLEAQRAIIELRQQAALDDREREHKERIAALTDEFNRWKTEQDNQTKIAVAQIGVSAKATPAKTGPDGEVIQEAVEPKGPDMSELITASMEALRAEFTAQVNRPRVPVRNAQGKVIGSRPARDEELSQFTQ